MKSMLLAAATAAFVTTPALAASDASAGLQALRELNVIVLGNLANSGGETEGKVYVGGNLTGNGLQIGFGNSQQGEAVSARPTLTVGGNLGVNVNLDNGSNGGSGSIAPASYGASVVGNAQSFDLHADAAIVNIGGSLQHIGLSKGTTLNLVGSLAGNLDLRDAVVANIGGSVNTVQGGTATRVNVTGNVQTLGFGANGTANIGGSLGQANLSSNSTVNVVGGIGSGNIGNNSTVRSGAGITSINGSSGTIVYAAGSISGNTNGASFNPFTIYGPGNPAPVAPTAPVVVSQAGATALLDTQLRALSAALSGLTVAANPSSIVWTGGTQRATFNAVDGGNGFALFNVNASIFAAQEFAYNFASTTLPVIINVSGASSYSWQANLIGDARAHNQQVIWNFGDATSIDFQRMVHGSILAPLATIQANVIEGSVAVRNFNQSNEVHLGTYAGGDVFGGTGAVPEPGGWALLIAGFGITGASLRRQRRPAVA